MACAAASDACAVSPGFHARAVGDYDGRRRQAPRPRRVRSHKACIKQVSKPQCRRTPTTTHHPARAYNTWTMRSARAAPRRAAGRGNEATTRGPDGTHGCDPRPSARIVGRDVRYWTGVRGPAPHKVLRAHDHERRVQGDGSRLPWPPLATGHPNRRRPPSPMPKQETRKPHVGQVGLRTTSGQRRKSPADPPICGAPTTTPVRTSSTATPLGLASKDAPRYGAYSRASYPPQTPAATAGGETAWSRTRYYDARRSPTPYTRITYTT